MARKSAKNDRSTGKAVVAKKPRRHKYAHLEVTAAVEHQSSGRPTEYTEKLAEVILGRLAAGETLTKICQDEKVPARQTVLRWKRDNLEGFRYRFFAAREDGMDAWADGLVDATTEWREDSSKAENGQIREWVKVEVDTRKWLMTRLNPDQWGNKSETKLSGKVDSDITIDGPDINIFFDEPEASDEPAPVSD